MDSEYRTDNEIAFERMRRNITNAEAAQHQHPGDNMDVMIRCKTCDFASGVSIPVAVLGVLLQALNRLGHDMTWSGE